MVAELAVRNPFAVVVDTAEGQPWSFQGLRADADKLEAPLTVPLRFACLGRHPDSLGDYAIDGLVGRAAVERKSLDDAIGTVLGWSSDYEIEQGRDGRRERFKRELANLAKLEAAVVVVEAPLETILQRMPGCDGDDYYDPATGECNATRGAKSVAENRKIFFRSIVSWQQRPELRVPWMFCSSRRAAEVFAFRYLEKYWQHLPASERKRVAAELVERSAWQPGGAA